MEKKSKCIIHGHSWELVGENYSTNTKTFRCRKCKKIRTLPKGEKLKQF